MNQETDRELLELAAKAAGYPWGKWVIDGDDSWNPLKDDGDALRIAVKLGLCVGPNLDGDLAVAFGREGQNITEQCGLDAYAATRRAIVRAAAEIGKAME